MKEQILNYKKEHLLKWTLIMCGGIMLTLFLNYFLVRILTPPQVKVNMMVNILYMISLLIICIIIYYNKVFGIIASIVAGSIVYYLLHKFSSKANFWIYFIVFYCLLDIILPSLVIYLVIIMGKILTRCCIRIEKIYDKTSDYIKRNNQKSAEQDFPNYFINFRWQPTKIGEILSYYDKVNLFQTEKEELKKEEVNSFSLYLINLHTFSTLSLSDLKDIKSYLHIANISDNHRKNFIEILKLIKQVGLMLGLGGLFLVGKAYLGKNNKLEVDQRWINTVSVNSQTAIVSFFRQIFEGNNWLLVLFVYSVLLVILVITTLTSLVFYGKKRSKSLKVLQEIVERCIEKKENGK